MESPPIDYLTLSTDSDEVKNMSRKRKIEWVYLLIKNKVIKEVLPKQWNKAWGAPPLTWYEYSDGRKFDLIKCATCSAVLAGRCGGHLKRHKRRECGNPEFELVESSFFEEQVVKTEPVTEEATPEPSSLPDSAELTHVEVDQNSTSKSPKKKSLKRNRRWIHDLVEQGVIQYATLKKRSKYDDENGFPAVMQYEYPDGRKFEYVNCTTCNAVLSGTCGGHLIRHKKKLCGTDRKDPSDYDHALQNSTFWSQVISTADSSRSQENAEIEKAVQSAIGDYCLKSGVNSSIFSKLESEPFRKMIKQCMSAVNSQMTASLDKLEFPDSDQIQEIVDKKCEDLFCEISQVVQSLLQQKLVTLHLDFGIIWSDWLISFLSFVDPNENKNAVLRMVPFSFVRLSDLNSDEDVRDCLIKGGNRYFLSANDILNMPVVSDSREDVKLSGKKFFKNWSESGSELIRSIPERMLALGNIYLKKFNNSEKAELHQCREVLVLCKNLSENKLEMLVPRTSMEIDPIVLFKNAMDVLNESETDNQEVSDTVEKLKKLSTHLSACHTVFKNFKPLADLFQLDKVTIQMYLPMLQHLQNILEDGDKKSTSSTEKTLYKMAKFLCLEFLEKKVSDIHLKTTILTPRLKKMSKASRIHREKATELLKNEILKVKLRKFPLVEPKKEERDSDTDIFASIYDDVDPAKTDEFAGYLLESIVDYSKDQCPLDYWFSEKGRYLVMSEIALGSFSIPPNRCIRKEVFDVMRNILAEHENEDVDWEIIENLMIGSFYSNLYN